MVTGRKKTTTAKAILNTLVTGVYEIISLEQEIIEICVGNISANKIMTVIIRLNNVVSVVETISSVLLVFFITVDFVTFMYL